MKRISLSFLVVFLTLSFVSADIYARRMGGGLSFGKPSPKFFKKSPSKSQSTPKKNSSSSFSNSKPDNVKGLFGGALLGLGLGALIMNFGIGPELLGFTINIFIFLVLFLFIVFFYRLILKQNNQNNFLKYNESTSFFNSINQQSQKNNNTVSNNFLSNTFDHNIQEKFDTHEFLKHAKINFLSLQAFWDEGNIDEIKELTTPEMFIEIKSHFDNAKILSNFSAVVSLDAELIGIETFDNEYLAYVKFTGMIKEDYSIDSEYFSEIWILSKPLNVNSGWLLAGIDQK